MLGMEAWAPHTGLRCRSRRVPGGATSAVWSSGAWKPPGCLPAAPPKPRWPARSGYRGRRPASGIAAGTRAASRRCGRQGRQAGRRPRAVGGGAGRGRLGAAQGTRSVRVRHRAVDAGAGRAGDRAAHRCAPPSWARVAHPAPTRLEPAAARSPRSRARRGRDRPLARPGVAQDQGGRRSAARGCASWTSQACRCAHRCGAPGRREG
jgi:hypothetical protein